MRRAPRLVGAFLIGALVLGACSVESSSSTDDPSESHIDDVSGNLLRAKGAATDAIAAIEQAVGASPARVREVDVYPEYLDLEAQDPAIPEHIDEYTYRDGEVGPRTAVMLTGPQEDVEASLFPTTSMRWDALPSIVKKVERAARTAKPIRIEEARANYVIVRRSTSPEDDGRVLLDIYLGGPRRSGYAEVTTSGDILALNVS
jgi:hypothetical protein